MLVVISLKRGSKCRRYLLLSAACWCWAFDCVCPGLQMSLAKLAAVPGDPWAPGYVTAATLLALLGLAVLVLVRVSSPPGPGRLMGVLAAVLYGIMVRHGRRGTGKATTTCMNACRTVHANSVLPCWQCWQQLCCN